jgi:membrane-associated phospholipid phosphatase
MLSFCLLLYVLFLLRVPAGNPKFIFSLPLSGVLVTFFYTIINRWIKISLHGGGAGILTGFIFAYYLNQEQFQFWVFFAVILASALTISSRLYLKKHSETEVYSGWALALLITFVTNYFYPHI